jgi:hypothetical protein
LNLLHYKGSGTYPAKEEPPTGSENNNITYGVSFWLRDTYEQWVATDGSVTVTESGTKVGAEVVGAIDAVVQPQPAGSVKAPVHITGAFGAPLVAV